MGIAASQGRFLGLTARKSDVEFQGQQINQARLNLANQSAAVIAAANANVMPVLSGTSDAEIAAFTASMAAYTAKFNADMTGLAPLQLQDKKLETQLKQLDTEQQSIQTELDAVSKVIDKNIEGSYKTFG